MTSLNFFRNPLRGLFGGADRPTVPVKELRERDRRRMLKHFLALERHDRLLRFGSPVNDEQITRYVNGIDFDRDLVFGVYNRVFKLVAVGHLAFADRDQDKHKSTEKDQVAEFGVSVLPIAIEALLQWRRSRKGTDHETQAHGPRSAEEIEAVVNADDE